MNKQTDKWLLGIVLVLAVTGFFIFLSASLGLLVREDHRFSGIIFTQGVSLILGICAMYVVSKIDSRLLKKYSLHVFIAGIAVTAAVFIQGFGVEHAGATRWLQVGSFSFQPAEFLKLGFVLYFAAWLTAVKIKVQSFTHGLLPFFLLVGTVGAILLEQPDTGTFMVILAAALAMFISSGAYWRHVFYLMFLTASGLSVLAYIRPYVMDRFLVFLNPVLDPQGVGYQIQQSLIAIGSGEIFGRGLGQSIQKFNYLPEPIGDSIFAVFSEEFGFIGGVFLISVFVAFAFRGLAIARNTTDYFSRLTLVGIVILITGQAFVNIGSMLGVFPLTGLPLPFVSHGGTALVFNFIAVGIALNISRYYRK